MYHILINPASRSGKGLKLWKETVEPYLLQKAIPYTPHFSSKPGGIAKLTKKITANATAQDPVELILLGGDGTLNELLQGITDFSGVIIRYIPTGSSNDLARDLGIPKDPVQAAKQALEATIIHKMDVGCITFSDGEVHKYVGSCGMGFDAAVCEEVNRSKFKVMLNRIGLGKLAYLAIAVKQLLTAKTTDCKLTIDGEETTLKKMIFISPMVHAFAGGGFMFCPGADSSDGIIDLCSATNKLPKACLLFVLPTAFLGKHYLFPGIRAHSGQEIHIKTTDPLWIHTDGEVLRYDTEMSVTCLKRALQLRY